MGHYETTLQHILGELERIDLLIQLQVRRARHMHSSADEAFRGLVLSDREMDELLACPIGLPGWAVAPESSLPAEIRTVIDRVHADIAQRKAESAKRGIVLRLDELARLFQLTPFDIDTLLVCLAPEIDLRYERLYAYLHDDVTRKRPSIDLALNLLSPSFEAKLAARQRFTSDAPLLEHHLLTLIDDPALPQPSLLSKYLKLDERVAGYLFGSDACDTRLLPYAKRVVPGTPLVDVLLPADVKDRLAKLVRRHVKGKGLVFYFDGPYGVGKQTTAEALCRETGLGLLVVDGGRVLHGDDATFQTVVKLVSREAALQQSAVYWRGFDALLADDRRVRLDLLLQAVERRSGLTFLAGDGPWEPMDGLQDRPFVRIAFALPGHDERMRLWEMSLKGDLPRDPDGGLEVLADRFLFSGGQIRDAAATARSLALQRDPDQTRLKMADLYAACRLQSSRKLAALARKITPHYTWDDIVLPPDQLAQLEEICNHAKYRRLVYDEWGFDRKLSLGKGLNMLFTGPPGTGKTMAAEVIARELQLDLYKIDLSQIVSKYIGETEKNLDRVFTVAQSSNAILFFDEADALFGKRSEVKDAHDRYANIEVGYLLQKMEEYDGITMLATNLRQHMDEAFVRRMHFIVEFPFPDEEHRRRIWEVTFPREAPLGEKVDFVALAREVRLAGGNIKNIALAAAFHAASDGKVIRMAHLIRAAGREHQKLGRTWNGVEQGL